MISYLRDVLTSKFSGCTLQDLLGSAIRFSIWVFSGIGVSRPPHNSCSTTFLSWLQVVNFKKRKVNSRVLNSTLTLSLRQRTRNISSKIPNSLHLPKAYIPFQQHLFLTQKLLGILKTGIVHLKKPS